MQRAVMVAIVLFGWVTRATPTAAQRREVVGVVRRTWTEQPIANAEVSVIGEDTWVCTNARGEYRLPVRSGPVSVIARHGEFMGRPRLLAGTDTSATLDVNPQLDLVGSYHSTQAGQFYSLGGNFVSTQLMAAPEIEFTNGRYYVAGVELVVRPSRCIGSAPARRRGGDS